VTPHNSGVLRPSGYEIYEARRHFLTIRRERTKSVQAEISGRAAVQRVSGWFCLVGSAETACALSEGLYRRVIPERLGTKDWQMAAISFQGSGMSVNRQGPSSTRLCKYPEDVLFDTEEGKHHDDWSILTFKVEHVKIFGWEHPDTQKQFTLELKDDSERCMYPHSVICLISDGAKCDRHQVKKPQLRTKDRVAALAHLKEGYSVPQD
jgi:hypothetical protein